MRTNNADSSEFETKIREKPGYEFIPMLFSPTIDEVMKKRYSKVENNKNIRIDYRNGDVSFKINRQ